MSELNLEIVTSQYYDVLKELGNIGAGNAMTALSQMIGSKIDMRVPQVKLLDFNELGQMIGGEEQIMVGVFLGVEGDITGSMLFLLDMASAKHLINKVMMGMGSPDEPNLTEMECSAMQEVGNIITGAYLNSLAMMTNLTIYPSPPSLTVDMAGAIISVPAIEFGIYGDKILMIQSQFFDDIEIDGYFVLVPDIDSYAKIMSEIIKVGMADLKTCVAPDGVTTLGLGSCVGVAIRDTGGKVGGLAHVMLPDSKAIKNSQSNIAKFADTAIVELVRQMEALGASRRKMVAKIAGGATMFNYSGKSDAMQVGSRNVEAVKAKLAELGIPILAEDTGLNYGRTVIFYPETGEFHIKAVGKPIEII